MIETLEDRIAAQNAVFVETYLANEDQDDAHIIACRKAGIIDPHFPIAVTAKQVLEKPEIQIAIKTLRPHLKKGARTDISRDTILADLESVFHSTLLTRDHAAANANRKLVAQLLGILTENVTIHHKHDVRLLTDDELAKIASRQPKVIDGEAKDITPGIGRMKLLDGGESV